MSKGVINPNASAWTLGVVWGASKDLAGSNLTWGTYCAEECDNMVWGTFVDSPVGEADNIVWGTDDGDNVVWGTDCAGADCAGVVWGSFVDSPVGVSDNIVWGTCNRGDDNDDQGDNVVWGTSGEVDSTVWGSSSEAEGSNLTWGSSGEDAPLFDDPEVEPATFDASVWEDLFGSATLDPLPTLVEPTPVVAVPPVLTPLTGGIGGI
jgi:hypothetical protein